jgi:hypothetical protein
MLQILTLTANNSVCGWANNGNAFMVVNGADIAVRCLLHRSIAHYFLPSFSAYYKHLNITTASSIEGVTVIAQYAIVYHLDGFDAATVRWFVSSFESYR